MDWISFMDWSLEICGVNFFNERTFPVFFGLGFGWGSFLGPVKQSKVCVFFG